MLKRWLIATTFLALLATSQQASAHAQGVGLGVAGGLSYSNTDIKGIDKTAGSSFLWGFFVDIPLLPTFYISPAAILYKLELGNGKRPATDIDLNFKFIVPIASLKLGAGVTAGITNAELAYSGHYGALGYIGFDLVSNLGVFLMLQYKRLLVSPQSVDALHAFAGAMFYF